MANTDTTALANLIAAGYDRELEYQLRSSPIFRQLVDKHPVDVTNPGTTVSLQIAQEFAALAVTPLTEGTDITAVAAPNPLRVTVTLNEYGNGTVETLKVKELSFAAIDPMVANIVGKNLVDSVDKLVQNQLDAATNVLGYNAAANTVPRTQASGTPFALASVTADDTLDGKLARYATALLRRRNAQGKAGDNYVGVVHPDVAVDLRADATNGGWVFPHQYVDTSNIYNAETGVYGGIRWVESPRATKVSSTATVYTSYVVGMQALVEAVNTEPHVVIGPQVDSLRRNFPIGWYALLGESIFRQEAIQLIKTSSSVAGL